MTLKTILRRGDFSSWLWHGPPAWLGQLDLSPSPKAATFLLLCLVHTYHKVFGGRVGSGVSFQGFAEPWLWLPRSAGTILKSALLAKCNCPFSPKRILALLSCFFFKPISYYRHVSAISTSLINISQKQQVFCHFRPLSKETLLIVDDSFAYILVMCFVAGFWCSFLSLTSHKSSLSESVFLFIRKEFICIKKVYWGFFPSLE